MGITNKNNNNQPRFGICFDVDGVLARGTIPFQQAVKAFKLISNDKGEIQVPTVFVTNALNRNCDKAAQISNWLGVQVQPSQMIQAQGPLELFTKFHDKFCLVIGQGKIGDIAKELGFKRICTLEEVADAYPLLDIVDHDNRKKIATQGYKEKEFPKIEAIMLLGEPKRWESALQLLVDLLKTDGKPNKAPAAVPDTHLPIIACNTDLQFMDRACMPRYGHGAFLVCLEALYKKVTGRELKYTALVGKPSEITMRYAEHCLSSQAKQLGITEPLQRLYLIGDTPEVDVVGTNLYQRYVDRLHKRLNNQMDVNLELNLVEDADNAGDVSQGQGRGHLKRALSYDTELPQSRNVPLSAALQPQTIGQAQAVLVCTGVYRPTADNESTLTLSENDEKHYQGHRDFPNNPALYKPSRIVNDVFEAVSLIADIEQFSLDDLHE